jgi:signal transduction histidine kinase
MVSLRTTEPVPGTGFEGRNPVPGTHLGLGLHIVRLVAEFHGGTVSAENLQGGVRFQVRVPLAARA